MREPTQNDQWVACAMANAALRTLATNLATYLATEVPAVDGLPRPENPQLVRDLINLAVDNVTDFIDATDLERTQFDADTAKRVAIEMMQDASAEIRRVVFGE